MSAVKNMIGLWTLIGVAGIGYGMWNIISPSDERKREILKDLPEANPLRMEESRQRNALMMQVLKEAAETNDNVARRF
ncbi:hypothetical protein AGOR_G00029020 [Albula goreensis]|uniref:Ubiquinol-cytochrome-c reductase complex assembly factor 3 n=2 Tax=Albula TaxID=54908 RepID=A0A8T3E6J1_9TELE|nr:hypothetical protein JZ751_023245 [Albula glossodonta]KAI1903614.1 hypothetical protein AGOR_G00029020 [Albula goreensis]